MMCYRYAAGAAYRQCFNDRVHLGEIDDFAMWNRALTDAEVAARWSVSLTNEIAAGNEPDLAIFYNFNDGTAVRTDAPAPAARVPARYVHAHATDAHAPLPTTREAPCSRSLSLSLSVCARGPPR